MHALGDLPARNSGTYNNLHTISPAQLRGWVGSTVAMLLARRQTDEGSSKECCLPPFSKMDYFSNHGSAC
jgi:hypothetical protein